MAPLTRLLAPTLFLGAQIASLSAASITSNVWDLSSDGYDYVIVGGGLSGLVLANRLSADNTTTVLVLEAGADARYSTFVNDPLKFTSLLMSPITNWMWETVSQATSGKTQKIAGGRVLGGSSSINGMAWTRGTKAQYDAIEALGNKGWNWETLNSYMKKAETFTPPSAIQISENATYDADAHGYSGPVGASYPIPYRTFKLYEAFVSAAQTVFGIARGNDFCDGNPNIASQTASSIHPSADGTTSLRSSSAVAYLYPIAPGPDHSGLQVLTNHQAHRITWSSSKDSNGNAIANGVEFSSTFLGRFGPTSSVNAKKEVIVSAGAIMSPHLLQLSGVGNPSLLSKVGVKTVIDLPSIGTGLQDQALNLILYAPSISTVAEGDFLGHGTEGASAIAFPTIQQLLGNDAAATVISNLRATAHGRAQDAVNRGAWTNVAGLEQIYQAQADLIADGETPVVEIAIQVVSPILGVTPWNLLPQTRGSVKLASTDPFTYPTIDPAYLNDDFDILIQTASVRASRQMFKTSPLSSTVAIEITPGEHALPLNASDAAYTSVVKSSYQPVYHPIGTVAMMPKDIGGSVDSNLLLYGASNVRVVDASIIPFQLSSHLSSTLYGIAEKAADIIIAARAS